MTPTLQAVEDARNRLARFGPVEAVPGNAPVYARLAVAASEDPDLVSLLASAPASQRRGTLFFAGVHYLLVAEEGHPLWASFSGEPASGDPFPVFRQFCMERADALREIFATRKTQTNEVQRSGYLLPAFGIVAQLSQKPLALIEPGAAAGLNLLFDRFLFDYGEAGSVGDPASPVRLAPEIKGNLRPPVPAAMPQVSGRVGIDLEPVDIFDEDSVRWLRACVWAEHRGRAEVLRRAIELAREDPPLVSHGDAVVDLAKHIEAAPPGAVVCVFQTNVMPYFNNEQIQSFIDLLRSASAERDIYWIASEGWALIVPLFGLEEPPRLPDTEYSMLAVLATVKNGEFSPRLLARAAPHGHWMQWLDGPSSG